MSDNYQVIADLDVDLETAEAAVDRLREWMTMQKIIKAAISDCVLGEPQGHAPDENYVLAVEQPYPFLFKLKTNGARFIAKRTVFYSAGNSNDLVCSNCGGRFEGQESWSDAVNEWFENKGFGLLACAHCRVKFPITEWRHDPPWAFGNAGIEFWNWPPLRQEFVTKVGDVLRHRVRLVWGKI
jgi:hypothetical protein